MKPARSSSATRIAAALALTALLVALGTTVGLGADTGSDGERCVGCPGCENGDCGDEDGHPATTHHHCCPTSCMSHAPLALPAAPSTSAPSPAQAMQVVPVVTETGRIPETPYRPPRA